MNPRRHQSTTRRALADAFSARLRELMHVERAPAPSDYPLVGLTPAETHAIGPVDDVWPLSPMQSLLVEAAAVRGGTVLDQWTCRLRGPLDVATFCRAWEAVLAIHPMLRARLHAVRAASTVAVVVDQTDASLATWRIDDWSGRSLEARQQAWQSLLLDERRHRVDPGVHPLLRFTLIKMDQEEYGFLWSAPDWMLDGWSWPIVFRDLGSFYVNPPAPANPSPTSPSYRSYLAWLARQSLDASEKFWRAQLAQFSSPTPLPIDHPDAAFGPRLEARVRLAADPWHAATTRARELGLTPTSLLMAAWASLLGRASARDDVVFGAAFNGRPADVPGIDGMVGPCTTNLPVRVRNPNGGSLAEVAATVQEAVFAASSHQFVSPLQVEEWSEVPWRLRLFDSLVVFQNYEVDAAAHTLGPDVRLESMNGPVHGNYTLTLVATPEPEGLDLRLFHSGGRCSPARAAEILSCLVDDLSSGLEQPRDRTTTRSRLDCPASRSTGPRFNGQARAPGSALERSIHAIWVRAFGPEVGVDDNFFDVGGHSLLAFRVLAALRSELGLCVSPADLFQCPTVASLARKLGGTRTMPLLSPDPSPASGQPANSLDAVQARAARARQALSRR